MRYAVMTAKHHDGFTLFNSGEAYSLSNDIAGGTNISPAGRDVAREFADAMRARGLRAGFYYSLLDWQHPDAYEMALPAYSKTERTRDHTRYLAYMRGHVNELLTNYGPLSTIWFDYSDPTHQGAAWGAAQLMSDMRAKQPEILVNNRLYFGLENKNGDYGTPEKYVPPTGLPGMDWEVNHTLNESYGFSAHDMNWKDTATVVRLLSDIVSKGGNLLLNIGPDANGRVPEAAERALRGVGAWMRLHGEAIYGTTASPFQRLPWGRATQKPGTLYLHIFDWPSDGRLMVPMQGEVRAARLLGSDATLKWGASEQESGRLVVELPAKAVDAAVSVVRLDLAGEVKPMSFLVFPAADGSITLTPHDATLEGKSIRVERVGVIGDVTHNIGYWLDPSATASWPVGIGAAQAGAYRARDRRLAVVPHGRGRPSRAADGRAPRDPARALEAGRGGRQCAGPAARAREVVGSPPDANLAHGATEPHERLAPARRPPRWNRPDRRNRFRHRVRVTVVAAHSDARFDREDIS
jgi:alpha-L-fucosidase